MDSRPSKLAMTKEIYGSTRGWQYSKSPVLVAVRPVLLDSSTCSNNNNNNNGQFTANSQAVEKQSALKNDSQRAATNFNAKADGYGSARTGSKSFSDSEELPRVRNSYNDNKSATVDFAEYDQTKQLESSIIDLVEQSALAAEEARLGSALVRAKEALDTLNMLRDETKAPTADQQQRRSQPMTTGARLFELSLMVNSNLAEQLQKNDRLEESMEVYTQLCKLANSSVHFSSNQQCDSSRYLLYRFGINIGNILYQMRDYQRALKHYRLTLDRMSSTAYKNLKIKLMHNIAITLMSAAEQQQQSGQAAAKDGLLSMSVLFADNSAQQQQQQLHASEQRGGDPRTSVLNRNHHKFALNLLTGQYLLGDRGAIMDTMRSLVRADICHHYRRVLEFVSDADSSNEGLRESLAAANKDHAIQRDNWMSVSSHAPVSTSSTVNQMGERSGRSTGATTSALGDDSPGSSGSGKLIGRDERAQATTSLSNNRAVSHLRGIPIPIPIPITTRLLEPTADEERRRVLLSAQGDRLEMLICKQHKLSDRSMIVGCQLLAELDERRPTTTTGQPAFDFCTQLLSTSETYGHLVNELEMNYAVRMLLSGHRQRALATFKQIEDRLAQLRSKDGAATARIRSPIIGINLCMLNSSAGDYTKASEHARAATALDESNPSGLTNLANCYYFKGDLGAAQAIYRRVVALDPCCWQANYNLALATRKLGLGLGELDETARRRLQSKSAEYTATTGKGSALSVVQLALLKQQQYSPSNDRSPGLELSSLIARSNSAPELALIASEMAQSDELACKTLQRANSEHPYHLPTLERLVALSIKVFDYRNAMRLLIDCIRIRPDQPRWYQILAECCRRAADYNQAIAIYKLVVNLFPRDAGCLRAVTKITDELGLSSDSEMFRARLNKLEGANSRQP